MGPKIPVTGVKTLAKIIKMFSIMKILKLNKKKILYAGTTRTLKRSQKHLKQQLNLRNIFILV